MPSAAAGIAPERASAILSQFDRKRRAAQIAVPTDDGRVRARLRELGEPITLFGEGPGDRRDRLREVLTIQAEQADARQDGDTPMGDSAAADEGQAEQEEEFYTEGIKELLEARRDIARYSLPRARARINRQREEASIPLRTHIKHRKHIKERLASFELFGTQIAGERPVSIARFSPSGTILATGNWGGSIKLLDIPTLNETATLRAHTGIVGGISWFPTATLPTSPVTPSTLNLASGGGGGQGGAPDIHLWSLDRTTPLSTLTGHTDRVCRLSFHPSGRYLASASFDTTWRLWDVSTGQELQLQEGHSRQVYTVAFHPDGSLVGSGGFDSLGRIWDLRTGRTVMMLDGHIRDIYALDWAADGHRILSGSADGWVKCWDLRAVRCTAAVGAHNGNVSDLVWYKGAGSQTDSNFKSNSNSTSDAGVSASAATPSNAGTFFVSSGFDKAVHVFSADDWALAASLTGHSGNVLSVDVSADARWIASCGHDRTVKLWGTGDGEAL